MGTCRDQRSFCSLLLKCSAFFSCFISTCNHRILNVAKRQPDLRRPFFPGYRCLLHRRYRPPHSGDRGPCGLACRAALCLPLCSPPASLTYPCSSDPAVRLLAVLVTEGSWRWLCPLPGLIPVPSPERMLLPALCLRGPVLSVVLILAFICFCFPSLHLLAAVPTAARRVLLGCGKEGADIMNPILQIRKLRFREFK